MQLIPGIRQDPRPLLQVDRAGQPIRWLSREAALDYYVRDRVAWTVGEPVVVLRGGVSRRGVLSELELHPVIAVRGADAGYYAGRPMPLTNRNLFLRDEQICLYCGQRYGSAQLTRDHILPASRGGPSSWENLATACRACNGRKGARTPEEAQMPLLALPYAPTFAEALLLEKRQVLADQMAFLRCGTSRPQRLLPQVA